MRLTERSMARIAEDLHAGDRAAAADHQRWLKEREPSPTAAVERVEFRGSWWMRLWRLPSVRGHA